MNGLAHCVTRVLILHAAIPTRAGSGCFALAIVGVGNEGQQLVARLRPTQGKSVPSVQFPMIFCEPIPTLERSINHLEDRDIADIALAAYPECANFGVSDRRFRFKPAGGFGGNRQAVSVQSGTPLRMGFGPGFGEPPLRDTSYLALAC